MTPAQQQIDNQINFTLLESKLVNAMQEIDTVYKLADAAGPEAEQVAIKLLRATNLIGGAQLALKHWQKQNKENDNG